jgi:hypothetical protein
MYKLIELANAPQEAEALSIVLQALVNSMVDYNESRGACRVKATNKGTILVYLASEGDKDGDNTDTVC